MTVGRPCVEREHSAEDAETDESANEQGILPSSVDARTLHDFDDVHRFAGMIVDAEDADEQESRTTHKHERELHSRVVLVAATPNADEQIHRDKSHLVEHEHREQVNRDEEPEYARREEYKPEEVFFSERFNLPGSESACKDDYSREKNHEHRDAVDTDSEVNVQRLKPHIRIGEKHKFVGVGSALTDKCVAEIKSRNEQERSPGSCHRTDLFNGLGEEKRTKREYRNNYKKEKYIKHNLKFSVSVSN